MSLPIIHKACILLQILRIVDQFNISQTFLAIKSFETYDRPSEESRVLISEMLVLEASPLTPIKAHESLKASFQICLDPISSIKCLA